MSRLTLDITDEDSLDDILNRTDHAIQYAEEQEVKDQEEFGDLFVSMVQSKKGNKNMDYLQILDGEDRSIGIYISDIDPMSNSQEPYKGI